MKAKPENPFQAQWRDLPPYHYRYCGIQGERLDWIRTLLIDGNLYFAPRSSFNDPFDCRVAFDFEAKKLKRMQYFNTLRTRFLPHVERSFHRQRIAEHERLRLTEEGRNHLTNVGLKSIDKHGMVSMAEPVNSVLMWSYYAEGHQGIALRFTLNPDLAFPHPVIPIRVNLRFFIPEDQVLRTFEHFDIHRVFTIVGSKAQDWSHEHEWRLITVKHTGYIQIPPEMLNGVVFGLRTPKQAEDQIRAWVKQRKAKTALLRIVNNPGTYILEAVEA